MAQIESKKFEVLIDALGDHPKGARIEADKITATGLTVERAIREKFVAPLDSEGRKIDEKQSTPETSEAEKIAEELRALLENPGGNTSEIEARLDKIEARLDALEKKPKGNDKTPPAPPAPPSTPPVNPPVTPPAA